MYMDDIAKYSDIHLMCRNILCAQKYASTLTKCVKKNSHDVKDHSSLFMVTCSQNSIPATLACCIPTFIDVSNMPKLLSKETIMA
jgi:hypothetical protein